MNGKNDGDDDNNDDVDDDNDDDDEKSRRKHQQQKQKCFNEVNEGSEAFENIDQKGKKYNVIQLPFMQHRFAFPHETFASPTLFRLHSLEIGGV